jgi:hypothetical protein
MQPPARRERSLLVWLIYVLGGVGAAVLFLSALFAAGGYFGSKDLAVRVEFEVSPLAVVVWGGLVVLALGTWAWRRRRVARP